MPLQNAGDGRIIGIVFSFEQGVEFCFQLVLIIRIKKVVPEKTIIPERSTVGTQHRNLKRGSFQWRYTEPFSLTGIHKCLCSLIECDKIIIMYLFEVMEMTSRKLGHVANHLVEQ